MAILNSLICNGSSRFLNKMYCGDIEVSGTAGFSSISASSITSTGTLSVTGVTTLSGATTINNSATISGTLTLTKATDLSGTANNSPALIVGGAVTSAHMEFDGNEIQTKNNATSVADLYLNHDGGKVFLGSSTYFLNNSLNATGDIKTDSDIFCETLRAKYYDLQTVFASSGGALIIAPTAIFPSATTSVTRKLVVTKPSTTTCKIEIYDASVNTTTLNTAYWQNGTAVKVSGIIGGIQTDTMDGTITSDTNIASNKLVVSVSGGNASSIAANTYDYGNYEKLSVMIYKIGTYKVGIFLDSVSTNNAAVIDIYSGTDNSVVVRSGNINGLSYTQSDGTSGTLALENGWGFYAKGNAYIEGHIVANSGRFANWTISDNLYYNSQTPSSTSITLSPAGKSSTASIGGSAANLTWAFTVKNVFGVTTAGAMYSTSGKIGGWTIGANALSTETYGSDNSVFLSNTNMASKSIGGRTGADWRFTIGSHFGVTNTGALYCNSVELTGSITATSGTIGGCSITDGKLYVSEANISGTLSAGKISVSDLSAFSATIGGFAINSTSIHTSNVEVTSNVDDSIALSSADFTRTINSTSRTGLRFAIGDKFGVTGDGAIYASSATISGALTASSGAVGDFTINGGKLYTNDHSAYNTAVDGVFLSKDYISLGSGGVTYFNKQGTGKIGPWTLSTTYIRNGNIGNATNKTVAGVYLGTDGLNISNGTAATTAYITKTAVNIGNKLTWDGTTLSVDGTIIANDGTIGGWNISTTSNQVTTANGGHYYKDSIYSQIAVAATEDQPANEYEVGMRARQSTNASITDHAFYVKRIQQGQAWTSANVRDLFHVSFGGTVYAEDFQAGRILYITDDDGGKSAALCAPPSSLANTLLIGAGIDRLGNIANSFSNIMIAPTNDIYISSSSKLYFSEPGNSCTTIDDDSIITNSISGFGTDALNISSTMNTSNIYISTASSAAARLGIKCTDVREGRLQVNTDGNFGIYDVTNSAWVIRSASDQSVYVPQKLLCQNYYDTTSRPVVCGVDTDKKKTGRMETTSSGFTLYGQFGASTSSSKTFASSGSDIRLKTNVTDTEITDALSVINKIKIRAFDWKNSELGHQKIGFIADELEQIDEKMSIGGGYDEDGIMNVKSVNTFYLQGYEVKAIQELHQLIKDQAIEIQKLKAKIKELKGM